MTPELSRQVSTERLPVKLLVTADEAELQSLARRLDIPAVRSMACHFTLKRRGDVVTAEGDLVARIVQTCVVSLEPGGAGRARAVHAALRPCWAGNR